MIIIFVEFIDQLIDYPINHASLSIYTKYLHEVSKLLTILVRGLVKEKYLMITLGEFFLFLHENLGGGYSLDWLPSN